MNSADRIGTRQAADVSKRMTTFSAGATICLATMLDDEFGCICESDSRNYRDVMDVRVTMEAGLGEIPSGTLGHCYIALFLAIYHLGYVAPAKLLYSKGAISILCYIATCYIAIL